MSCIDSFNRMLTSIRNGQAAYLSSVVVPASRFCIDVLKTFERSGYISGFEVDREDPKKPEIRVDLKYHGGKPVIRILKGVSSPGRRVYTGIKHLKPYRNGLGVVVLATNKGVLSDKEARSFGVGGEVLCIVF